MSVQCRAFVCVRMSKQVIQCKRERPTGRESHTEVEIERELVCVCVKTKSRGGSRMHAERLRPTAGRLTQRQHGAINRRMEETSHRMVHKGAHTNRRMVHGGDQPFEWSGEGARTSAARAGPSASGQTTAQCRNWQCGTKSNGRTPINHTSAAAMTS